MIQRCRINCPILKRNLLCIKEFRQIIYPEEDDIKLRHSIINRQMHLAQK